MTERANQLHEVADGQIAELIALASTLDEAALRQPVPGRAKLGDGTVGACLRHTADNYRRIASFVQTSGRLAGAPEPGQHGARRIPRLLRGLGHGSPDHAEHGPGDVGHDDLYTAETADPGAVVQQLSASRDTLGRIGELTDAQLDAIPPDGSFRFCDGERTLEQVLASLLKHQRHQLDALKAAR
jgi:hypothetical protein